MVDGERSAVGVGVRTGRGGGGVKREGEREEGEGNERVGVRSGARLDRAWKNDLDSLKAKNGLDSPKAELGRQSTSYSLNSSKDCMLRVRLKQDGHGCVAWSGPTFSSGQDREQVRLQQASQGRTGSDACWTAAARPSGCRVWEKGGDVAQAGTLIRCVF
jgi:hypothetical protein